MLAGRLTKLFLLKSSILNDIKDPRESGSVSRLQLPMFNSFKECKPVKEGNDKHVDSRFLFGSKNDQGNKLQVFGGCKPHPCKDSIFSFPNSAIDAGICLIAVLLICSTSKHSTSPKSCGNLSSFEQPWRSRVCSDFIPDTLLGKFARFMQFLKFNSISFLRMPTDLWTSSSFVQPSKFKLSRFGIPVKSGVPIKLQE